MLQMSFLCSALLACIYIRSRTNAVPRHSIHIIICYIHTEQSTVLSGIHITVPTSPTLVYTSVLCWTFPFEIVSSMRHIPKFIDYITSSPLSNTILPEGHHRPPSRDLTTRPPSTRKHPGHTQCLKNGFTMCQPVHG